MFLGPFYFDGLLCQFFHSPVCEPEGPGRGGWCLEIEMQQVFVAAGEVKGLVSI